MAKLTLLQNYHLKLLNMQKSPISAKKLAKEYPGIRVPTLDSLEAKKLIKRENYGWGIYKYKITPAGKTALKSQNKC